MTHTVILYDSYSMNHIFMTLKRPDSNKYLMACIDQENQLNMFYTIGTSILSSVTMPLGLIMDKHGCRIMRLVGIITFFISTGKFRIF